MMRDRRAAIDAMGSNHRTSGPPLTAEQARKLDEDMKQLEKEKEEKRKKLAKSLCRYICPIKKRSRSSCTSGKPGEYEQAASKRSKDR